MSQKSSWWSTTCMRGRNTIRLDYIWRNPAKSGRRQATVNLVVKWKDSWILEKEWILRNIISSKIEVIESLWRKGKLIIHDLYTGENTGNSKQSYWNIEEDEFVRQGHKWRNTVKSGREKTMVNMEKI